VSQSPEGRFREYLASRPEPKRFTDQQRELLEHIFARHKHFDTKELLADLKAAGRLVSRPTVYRTSHCWWTRASYADRDRHRTVYDHDYGYPFHDHLVCEQCGEMIEFQHPKLDEVVRERRGHQFQVRAGRWSSAGVRRVQPGEGRERRLVM